MVDVTFRAGHDIGTFDDRIELQFFDTETNLRFVIWRALHAEVGDKQVLQALQPTSEYTPPVRSFTAIDDESNLETIGKPWQDPFRVQWAGSLPAFKIPDDLMTALKGEPKRLRSVIQKTFMPKTLTLETYSQHWQVLLHIEEAQQT